MATEAQAEFFKFLYEEQTKRRKNLSERSKFYFTIISFYLGVIYFKFQDVVKDPVVPPILFWSGIVSAALLTIGLVFTVVGTRVKPYAKPCDLDDYFKGLGATPPTDADFFDDRIVDYSAAVSQNSILNQETARSLRVVGWSIVAAVISQFLGLILAHFIS